MDTHGTRKLVIVLCLFLTSCGATHAPVGKWEGFSQSADWLVAARLQVDPGNVMHASALTIQVAGASLPERFAFSAKMKQMQKEQWPDAAIGKIEFKNNTITKEGGYAPLFVFDPKHKTMTFYFYAHGKLTERIKLYPVKEFRIS